MSLTIATNKNRETPTPKGHWYATSTNSRKWNAGQNPFMERRDTTKGERAATGAKYMTDLRCVATKGAAFTYGVKGDGFKFYTVTDVTPTSITAEECPTWEDAMAGGTVADVLALRAQTEASKAERAAIIEDTSFNVDDFTTPAPPDRQTMMARIEAAMAKLTAEYMALVNQGEVTP